MPIPTSKVLPAKVLLGSIILLVLVGLVACTPSSPEERVAEARSKYRVTLNTFFAQQPEVEEMTDEMTGGAMDEMTMDEMATDVAASASAAAGDEAAAADEAAPMDGEEGMDEELDMGPQPTNMLFDLVVLFEGTDPLDGLTLDISQADPFEAEKATFRHYIDLGPMVKSETRQVSFELEIMDYEEGDLFSVNLREYVAPEDRSAYREFVEAE